MGNKQSAEYTPLVKSPTVPLTYSTNTIVNTPSDYNPVKQVPTIPTAYLSVNNLPYNGKMSLEDAVKQLKCPVANQSFTDRETAYRNFKNNLNDQLRELTGFYCRILINNNIVYFMPYYKPVSTAAEVEHKGPITDDVTRECMFHTRPHVSGKFDWRIGLL